MKKIYKINLLKILTFEIKKYTISIVHVNADVAELVDALVLGTSVTDVGVRVPSSAPQF